MEATGFIPAAEVRKILHGSHEHLIARLDEVIQQDRKRLFGSSDAQVRVLGTFSGSAVVACSDGRFVRARFEDVSGALRILGHEELNVPTVTQKSLPDFVKKEAAGVVEQFLRGDTSGAKKRLEGLTFFVDERANLTDRQVTESVIVSMRAERPWKRLFRERAEHLRQFLKDDLSQLEAVALQQKFQKLYDGSVAETEMEGFRDLVTSDLSYLKERLEALADLVETSAAQVGGLEAKFRELGEDATLTSFRAFAEDLVEDLRGVSMTVSESAKQLDCVSCLGEVYDTVVKDLQQFEMAGRFVERMAAKLRLAR